MKLYFATKSSTFVQRQLQCQNPQKKTPHRHAITRLLEKFGGIESVVDNNKSHSSRKFTARRRFGFKKRGISWNSCLVIPPDGCNGKLRFPVELYNK